MILEIKNMFAGYDDAFLEEVNIAIEHPQLIGLVGINGSGKSTLLKAICGLIKPVKGSIYLNEQSIISFTSTELAKQITYLPSAKSFYANLTVNELILLSSNQGLPFSFQPTQVSPKQLELLAKFGISDLLNRKLYSLSDGQYQLASIVFSISRNTPIILLDEPLAFLDYSNRKLFTNQLSGLVKTENKVLVFSSHDLHVLQACDSVWSIDSTKLVNISKEEIADFSGNLLR